MLDQIQAPPTTIPSFKGGLLPSQNETSLKSLNHQYSLISTQFATHWRQVLESYTDNSVMQRGRFQCPSSHCGH